eukprot:gb/GECG01012158.1/.p1 GENE.gb/GECG01012158.1/~~gb/GECG01012158.1/.p1  ORF type:complete len:410 (+),score=49.37 gb/GECG01012158.1/:1-1230(+)
MRFHLVLSVVLASSMLWMNDAAAFHTAHRPVSYLRRHSTADSDRLVPIQGSTAFARGVSMGKALKDSVDAIFDLQKREYAERMAYWKSMAKNIEEYIEEYAPVTYAEMLGMNQAGIEWETLLLMACNYEMFMTDGVWLKEGLTAKGELWKKVLPEARQRQGHCTAFSSYGTTAQEQPQYAGQNNDEDPPMWANATHDVVMHLGKGEANESLIYTHPGLPAYMGMNKNGLSVLWQYIDNGERNINEGVPTCVLLREVLKFGKIEDAVDYLRSTPRTVPNNFLLSQCGYGANNIECSPTHFTEVRVARGDVTHANGIIFDEEMASHEIHIVNNTSPARYKAIKEMINEYRSGMNPSVGMKMLSTPPVFNNDTMASMVFDPQEGAMHIRFMGDQNYQKFSLSSGSPLCNRRR